MYICFCSLMFGLLFGCLNGGFPVCIQSHGQQQLHIILIGGGPSGASYYIFMEGAAAHCVATMEKTKIIFFIWIILMWVGKTQRPHFDQGER